MPTRLGGGRGDFSAARRFGIAHVIGAVVVITTGIGLVTFEAVRNRNANIATAKAWDIQGPPCPALTEAEFRAKRYTALKTFDYDSIAIGRTAGDANCSDIKEAGGKGLGTDKVCQFTSPATLTVVSKAGSYFFVPGAGQPASLIIHRDVPRCVMASNFTLQSE
ncbi:MAG: hypothetical protein JWP23_1233 [Phenylobacterium sp.]|nr:hypothetical protein [Phenylobacterium sp.]